MLSDEKKNFRQTTWCRKLQPTTIIIIFMRVGRKLCYGGGRKGENADRRKDTSDEVWKPAKRSGRKKWTEKHFSGKMEIVPKIYVV